MALAVKPGQVSSVWVKGTHLKRLRGNVKGEEPPGFLQAAKGQMCSALPEDLGRWSDGGVRFSAAEVVKGGERAKQP